jgi:fructan beta-fructosidase
MVVAKALEKKIKFYTSPDLKEWTWMSDFGPAGDNEKSWNAQICFNCQLTEAPRKRNG